MLEEVIYDFQDKEEVYDFIGNIGKGAFGIVYRAKERNSGRIVAIKKIWAGNEDKGVSIAALREISVLKRLDHPNIVKLEDLLYRDSELYLVFEYFDYDLKKFLDLSDNVPLGTVKRYMFQLLRGLAYCHSNNIMHRDLKPQNLLLDLEGNLKLADFGIARLMSVTDKEYTPDMVTLWYRAPEILLGHKKYTPAIDIWSVGCIFAEMLRKTPIFPGDSEINQLISIFSILGTPNEDSWPGFCKYNTFNVQFSSLPPQDMNRIVPMLDREGHDLLMKLLTYCPKSRVSATIALMHPYIRL